jgi:hypothetical protein
MAALEADEDDQREMLGVADFMGSMRAAGWHSGQEVGASKSGLSTSACVVSIPCEKPGYVFSVPFCTSSTARGPELSWETAGRVPDVDGVMQVEVLGQVGKVAGVVDHVVALADLRGAAVPAPVMGDHPVPVVQEEKHLGVPVVGRQGPPAEPGVSG